MAAGQSTESGESFEQAKETAAAAVAQLNHLRIPATPENYALWYKYFSKGNAELTSTMDGYLAKPDSVTPELCDQLYKQLVSGEDEREVLEQASASLQDQLQNVMKYLGDAGNETAQYSDALEEFSGQVAEADGPEGLRALVAGMVAQTQTMQQRTQELESELKSSASQIESLKQDLEQTRMEAGTDELTGIPNRKHFENELRRMTEEAIDSGEELCLVIGDVDFFKKFNDNWGHQLGDQVLKLVGMTLKNGISKRDCVARYGGEEFVILLPKTSLHDAVSLSNQIRLAVQSKKLVKKSTGEDVGQIRMSFGVALYKKNEPCDELVRRADEALYAAKRTGRNKVVSQQEAALAATG